MARSLQPGRQCVEVSLFVGTKANLLFQEEEISGGLGGDGKSSRPDSPSSGWSRGDSPCPSVKTEGGDLING